MIDFLKYRYVCLVTSVLFIGVGAVAYIQRGGFDYHIDFVGGTELTVSFEKPTSIDDLRRGAQDKGWKDLTIQSIGYADAASGNYHEFLVRMAETDDGIENRFSTDIASAITGNKMEVRGVSRVGADVGKDIQSNAMWAIIWSLLIILLYVSFRSKYRYAAGAVVAIAHDMLAVLVIFILMGEQISVPVLAAILAILGYSLNDTLVIFSRVRENLKKMKGASEIEVVNVSINQTLRRTMLTSITTLLTVLSIFFLGGEALHGFALAMIIGVVFGTYSSVYIASPVMLAFGKHN